MALYEKLVLNYKAEEVAYPKDAFDKQYGNALFPAIIKLTPTLGDISLQALDQNSGQ